MDGGDGGVVVGGRGAAGIAQGGVGRGELLGIWIRGREFGIWMEEIVIGRAEGEGEEERRDVRTRGVDRIIGRRKGTAGGRDGRRSSVSPMAVVAAVRRPAGSINTEYNQPRKTHA